MDESCMSGTSASDEAAPGFNCLLRICLPSSSRVIDLIHVGGALLRAGADALDHQIRNGRRNLGFRSCGVSMRVSSRKLFSPFLFTV